MNSHQATNWLPGLVMLAAGVSIALVYLFGSKRLQADAPKPETLDDLDARYALILEQLRTHVANKHLVGADEFKAEKSRLEQAAAEVLRARDGKKHEETKRQARAEKVQAAPPSFASKNQGLVGALVGGAVVAFFAFLGWNLSQSSIERRDGMSATGMVPPGGGPGPMQQAPQKDLKLEALAGKVRAAPEDVDAVADLAVYLIRRQAFEDARPLVDRTTALDPYHPKGRVGRSVMRAIDGDIRGAIDELEQLASRYPEAYDASMFAGLLSLEDNDQRRALKNLEQYVTLAPMSEQPPMMRMAVTELRQQLNTPPQP
ncbi:MAG TPA: hypothetical protein VGE37_11700 [Archangium sp.]